MIEQLPEYHLVPGRLRVKLDAIKRNPGQSRLVQGELLKLAGVRDACVNTLTGSVVVRFDPAVASVSRIVEALRTAGPLDARAVPATVTRVSRPAKLGALADVVLDKALEKLLERCAIAVIAALV